MANERFSEFTEETPKTFVQGLFEESATQKHKLGTIRRLSDGREFVYCQAGTSALAAGKVVQAEAANMALTGNLPVTANANVGERTVSITIGATSDANTANAFAEGYLWENTANAANGCSYKIKSHAAIAANANGNIALYDKIHSNLTTSSNVSIRKHKCKQVIIHTSPPLATVVGVPTFPVTANYYFWAQTKGECAVFVDAVGAITPGDKLVTSNTVDGAVMVSTNGWEAEPVVGLATANNAANHYTLVDLKIT